MEVRTSRSRKEEDVGCQKRVTKQIPAPTSWLHLPRLPQASWRSHLNPPVGVTTEAMLWEESNESKYLRKVPMVPELKKERIWRLVQECTHAHTQAQAHIHPHYKSLIYPIEKYFLPTNLNAYTLVGYTAFAKIG